MSVLYPQVDLAEWKERHGLEGDSIECGDCGSPRPYVRPIAVRTDEGVYFGMQVGGPCKKCGRKGLAAQMTPASKQSRDFWRRVLG